MNNFGNLFADELSEWLLELAFIQYHYNMSIYYKLAPDGIKGFLLHSITLKLYRSDQIIRRHQETLDKATLKEIKSLTNNQNFLVHDPDKGEPVTPCMDVYREKIKSDGSIDKLKLKIVVRRDVQNK